MKSSKKITGLPQMNKNAPNEGRRVKMNVPGTLMIEVIDNGIGIS